MQPTLKRIDPADTPALFKRVGMFPAYGDFGTLAGDLPCGCLLTALAVDARGIRRAKDAIAFAGEPRHETLSALAGLDFDYGLGIVCGWDDAANGNSSFDTPMPDTEAACRTAREFGYLDAMAAFQTINTGGSSHASE